MARPGPTQLNPTAPGNRSYPSWSPSGAQIAYTRGPPGATGGIWTINRAGGPNEAALLAGAGVGEVWELSYSPDGSKIGFVSDVGGPLQEELFTVNSNGTGVARLNVDANIAMDWGKPSPAPAGLAAPVLGRTVNVRAVSGRVTIGVRGGGSGARASQKGVRFVPLTQARSIPVGSFINTRRGKIRLTSARDTKGATQTGDFSAGLFQVLQSRSRRAKGLTELRLKGSSFRRCTARRSGKRAQAAARRRLSKRAIRRLRSKATGRFRTRGRHSSATVRGTSWTTTDRCDGTLTKVTRGRVAVRDFKRKRTISLRRGKSYLAKARR